MDYDCYHIIDFEVCLICRKSVHYHTYHNALLDIGDFNGLGNHEAVLLMKVFSFCFEEIPFQDYAHSG